MLIALVAAGFALGAVPFGYLVARLMGVDIRKEGSGNIGATNVGRTLGKGPAAAVLLLDVIKGFAPAFVARLLIPDDPVFSAAVAGLAAVIGHMFSPFLKFNGGKGVATALGMLLGLEPIVAGIVLAVFIVGMIATRIVSLSSLLAGIAAPVGAYFVIGDLRVVAACLVLSALVFIRHAPNIKRIIAKEEKPFAFKK